jgi:uroporphyrinogen decarboxylase
MNHRERLVASLQHRQPDRVPVDLGASTSSGISAVAYADLLRCLGKDARPRVYEVVQQIAQPGDDVLDRFGASVISIGRAYDPEDSAWYPFTLPDRTLVEMPSWFSPRPGNNGGLVMVNRGGEEVGVMPAGASFFDQTCYPYLDGYPEDYSDLSAAQMRTTWGAYPAAPWIYAAQSDFWADLRARTLAVRSSTDRGLVAAGPGKLFEWGCFLRRIDNFLMDIAQQPAEVERFCDALLERQLPVLEKFCQAVGDLVDVIRLGDDLGMDSGPLISPRAYRRIFKPRHKAICDTIRKHTDAPICLHSCGSIYSLLPDLIEAGFQAFNPVQITSRDMEPWRLKREFGRDATFWGGGCDTRHVLNRGTPREVKEHVQANLEVFALGGGFVFAAVHNILPDVPGENVIAMFEAVEEFNGHA